jgi:hypothetical protein
VCANGAMVMGPEIGPRVQLCAEDLARISGNAKHLSRI